MAQGNAERLEKDKQRKLEIARQEQLLSGRIQRAKTEEHGDPSGRGPGIQIYHYKDPGALPSYSIAYNSSKTTFRLFRGGADCEEHKEGGDPSEDEPWRAAQRLQQRVQQRKLQRVQQRGEQRKFQRVRCAEYKWGGGENRVL